MVKACQSVCPFAIRLSAPPPPSLTVSPALSTPPPTCPPSAGLLRPLGEGRGRGPPGPGTGGQGPMPDPVTGVLAGVAQGGQWEVLERERRTRLH